MHNINSRIAIQSHLSDSLIEVFTNSTLAYQRIRFVKQLLIMQHNDDLKEWVSEDYLNEIWNKTNPQNVNNQ